MKRIFLFVGIFLFFMIFLQSCWNCHSREAGRQKLVQSDLDIVPYHGSENLVFIDSLNDSLNFQFSGRNGKMLVFQTGHNECPGEYYVNEVDVSEFTGINSDLISFSIGFSNSWSNDNEKSIGIYITCCNNTMKFEGGYSIELGQLYTEQNSKDSVIALHDSIKILNKTFYSVYELKNVHEQYMHNWTSYAYYSINQGLVGFKSDNGKVWRLK